MSNKNTKKRSDIPSKYKWNIENMYNDEKLWQSDLDEALNLCNKFTDMQGHILDSSDTLLEALNLKDSIWRLAEKAYVYARMKQDEDNNVAQSQENNGNCQALLSKISAMTSFFLPELLSSDEAKILKFIEENKELKIYEFALKSILKEKAHVLSESEESIMAQMGEVTSATNNIFTMLNNADMTFGSVVDDDGEKITLTHGNYIKFMESKNRAVRKNAYENMYTSYKNLSNTLATTYNYNTKTDVVTSRIRKYPSCLAASLSSDNIPLEVYHNLIEIVNEALPTLHKYVDLRKKILKVDELKMYDVYVPLVNIPKKEYTYEQSIDLMLKGLAPLGDEYLKVAKEGALKGWVDVYENIGKTSGAYSFGSYDSFPYILLNYTDTLKDVFTLVHEMGHSMHSYYTRKTQPFAYGGHSIFTAEVASTVNECLLMKHLLATESDKEIKKYIINLFIEEFRTTLFRQTMFAEFELLTHTKAEEGITLTAEFLSSEYSALNRKYFGDSLADDDFIKYEWSRIPHFYRAFYVYQYATGFSAANAISDKILNEGPAAVAGYKEFLCSGDSSYPVELLKLAGIDMSSPEPIRAAMATFKRLVDEFEELV